MADIKKNSKQKINQLEKYQKTKYWDFFAFFALGLGIGIILTDKSLLMLALVILIVLIIIILSEIII